MRAILLSFSALGLAACGLNPSPLPTGYKYHHDEIYKSAPGPEAAPLGYDYAVGKNDEILEVWRIVAGDLFDTLEERTGLGAQPVYVHAAGGDSAFYNSFDHVLREELRDRGYVLMPSMGDNLVLSYEALLPEKADEMPGTSDTDLGDYILKLTASRGGALSGHASGVYKVPSYGFRELKDDERVEFLPIDPQGGVSL